MKRLRFWYVYPDGFITDDLSLRVMGYVAVIDAESLEDAEKQLAELGIF